jgi:zinc-dependent metalloproteinase lipoprotein
MHSICTLRFVKTLVLVSFGITFFVAEMHAQTMVFGPIKKLKVSHDHSKCYTVPYMQQLNKAAGAANADAMFENFMTQKLQEKKKLQTLGTITNYNLPVVFHIIHSGSLPGNGDNVSQARIQSQMAQLNKDFANLSNSPHGVASTSGLQFYLAQNDPNGVPLAEPGIHRVNAPSELPALGAAPYTIFDFNASAKPGTIWDPNRYINIWVAPLDDDILGFATFPTLSGLPGMLGGESASNAGVVVDDQTVGSLVNQSVSCAILPTNAGKTLVHEMGHFFGLRHIWGDDVCGNDFVDDTPIHENANYGVPTRPKSNNCGTLDEMFQNYMDYTDDVVLSTLTVNQVDRIQTVMQNSPRRRELPSSNVGSVNFTSNRISFVACGSAASVAETGNTGDPLRYRDLKLTLSAEDRANGAATVNITAVGTATAGVDFDLLTPSVVFANGDGFKEVTVRIWDDGIPENNETINFTYSITGTGVTPGIVPQFALTIVDDDNFVVAQTPVALLRQNFDTTITNWNPLSNETNPLPENGFTAGSGAVGFTGRSAYISNNRTAGEFATNTYNIDDVGGSLSILRTPLVNAAGFTNLSLSFRYSCAGEKDATGTYDFGTLAFAPSTNGFLFNTVPNAPELVNQPTAINTTYNFPSSFNGTSFFLGFYWENDDNTGTQPPLAVDDIVLTASGKKVEQNLNASRGNTVNAGTRVFFTSVQNGDLIAMVENASASIGTVVASIAQAGTTQENIITQAGTFKRTAKVIKISPTTTYSGTSAVTLYFTQAEIAAWGGTLSTLKVMQVRDGVNLSTGVNPGNAVILNPVVDNRLAERGYISYTVTATGFSQFFLVETATVLPVQWVSFTARAASNAINLDWQTTNEVNNKGFGIERSTDGINYSNIGFVASKASTGSASVISYLFADTRAVPGVLYYYRLKQEDRDGRFAYSPVRMASIAAVGLFKIFPNPAQSSVQFTPARPIVASLKLLGQNGQLLKTWPRQSIPSSGMYLELPGLPPGVYTLQVVEDKTITPLRLTIQ